MIPKKLELTLAEALEIAQRTPPRTANQSRKRDADWAGVTFEQAIDKAVNGDHRIALRINKKLGQYASLRGAAMPTQQWDVSGSAVDIARYLSGELDCMVETMYATQPRPVMKIAIERAVPWYTTTDEMEDTGVSVLAVVEALRLAGVAAEIWVTFTITDYGNKLHTTAILIQEPGRPIDLDRLAYWTADPTTLRRIAFAIWEQQDGDFREQFGIGTSYGHPRSPDKKDWDEIAPARSGDVTTWIRDVLARRAGLTIEGVKL